LQFTDGALQFEAFARGFFFDRFQLAAKTGTLNGQSNQPNW
jgi:hypothetical protein